MWPARQELTRAEFGTTDVGLVADQRVATILPWVKLMVIDGPQIALLTCVERRQILSTPLFGVDEVLANQKKK